MSSSEGASGSDEQTDESVEYSGAPVDGMVFLILGVVAIIVIVVVVLLVVFLLNRNPASESEKANATEPGHVCGNPCNGIGRVCHPDSKRDVHGCFVQNCRCYTPNETHHCSNPCNMTGQVCNFKTTPLDADGCVMASKCHCVTCPNHCGVDQKCDANSPYGPDGCPMPNCICVPKECPARCRIGEQCPDVDRDENSCLPQDCTCVPISRMTNTTKSTTTSIGGISSSAYPCPDVCENGSSCHPHSPVDVNNCFEPGCKCVNDTCPNPCSGGQVCAYNTSLEADGCLEDPCVCVPISPAKSTTASIGGLSSSANPCPDVCAPGSSCHPHSPVDVNHCFEAGCKCVNDTCPNPCSGGQVCAYNTSLDAGGCLEDPCVCIAARFLTEDTRETVDPNATQPGAAGVTREQPEGDQVDNSTGSPAGSPGADNSSSAAEHTSGLGGGDATSVGPHTAEESDEESKADEAISKDNETSSALAQDNTPPSSHGDTDHLGSEQPVGKTETSSTDAQAAGDGHTGTQVDTVAPTAETSTVSSSGDDQSGTQIDTVAPAAETSTVGSSGDDASSKGAEANETAPDASDATAASTNSSKVRRSVKGSGHAAMGTREDIPTFDVFGMA